MKSERKKESEVTQLCATPCDPTDCSLPGSSVHGFFQARVLEWVASSFSRGSSRPKDQTQVSRTVGRRFTVWANREVMTNLDSILKNRDITLPTKVCIVKSYGFSSSHVWVWELNHKEGWALRNWCFWTAVLEKTLESLLDFKEIQLVHPKGNQSWIFSGRTDVAETPILWPPDAKNWLIWKDPDAGKDWRHEEKGMTEDEMAW